VGWSIRHPRELHVEHSAAASRDVLYDETTFASFRSKPGVIHRVSPLSESIFFVPPRTASERFPSNGIVLRVEDAGHVFPGARRFHPPATRLPLHLSQFHEVQRGRLLSHSLVIAGRPYDHYDILVWTGPRASTQQRALLDRMIASIAANPTRARS
jgi:hypothetical protein